MTLAETIHAIRKRLKLTQSGFGKRIGVRPNTVSQYENGLILPGRSALLLLLAQAQDSERPPILKALGLKPEDVEGLNPENLADAAKKLDDYLDQPTAKSTPGLFEFTRLMREIVSREEDVDASINGILAYWLQFSHDRRARKLFSNAKLYLDVELAQVKKRG